MELHPDCASLAWLLGTWKGGGAGEYPTIDAFEYFEEVTFGHVGKPFLAYTQKTRHAETGLPLHAESGYLRSLGENRVEFVVSQPSGIVELHSGSVEGTSLRLALDSVHTTPGAKRVNDVVRSMGLNDDGALAYTVSMAAVGEPVTHHLRATLSFVPQDE